MEDKRPMTRAEKNMEWHGNHIPYHIPRRSVSVNDESKSKKEENRFGMQTQ